MLISRTGTLAERPQEVESFMQSLAMLRRAAYSLYPQASHFHRWRRWRFYLRSALSWQTTVAWLRCCATPLLRDLAVRHVTLLERMHRPFLYRKLGPAGRLRASLDHYAIAMPRAPQLARQISAEGHVALASFTTGERLWHVALESSMQFSNEGDWTLTIRDESGHRLVSCTFSFVYLNAHNPRPHLCIGCVQGPDSHTNGRETFRVLTKHWHGLRPKVFAVYLTQCIAAALAIDEIVLVSNRHHVYASRRYCLRKQRIAADYDALSRECGAVDFWNGWHVLATRTRVVSVAAPGTGRANNGPRKKRQALRSHLAQQILDSIAALA